MISQPRVGNRKGIAAMEVVLLAGSLFIIAMMSFWIGELGFVGLYYLIAGHIGSPYM